MLKHLEKFHVMHLWLGQHDALCDQNYVWCDQDLTRSICGILYDWVKIPILLFYFISLNANSSILIPPLVVPYVIALDRMIFPSTLVLPALYKYL